MKAIAVSKFLNGPERAFGALALFLTILWPIVAAVKGVTINMGLTAFAFGLQGGLIILGLYFRIRHDSEKVARLAISLGYYLIFVTSVTNLITMRFPIDALRLDPILQTIDDAIGYNWAESLAWLANWPSVGNALAIIYNTSLFQLAFLMAVLLLTGKDRTHYRFLTTAALSLFSTVAIWMVWPSFGPAISQTIPEGVVGTMTLIVGPEYQTEMLRRVASGATSVPPVTTLGLVAFPSYHTIMTLLVVVYSWRTFAGWPLLFLNILMLPAILIQGAHYVPDVIAGIVVFLISALVAKKLIVGPEKWGTHAEQG